MKKYLLLLLILLAGVAALGRNKLADNKLTGKKIVDVTEKNEDVKVTATPTITATPTVKQLTVEDYERLYGPCANVRVLMYHHVQTNEIAKEGGYSGLNVNVDDFRKQMEFLARNNYNVIWVDDIAEYFNSGKAIPPKAVAITFDDAYTDNYTNAYPILKEFGLKATIFTPTGLVNNTNYLNWEQINEMGNSGLISFGNHTWSHQSSNGSLEKLDMEVKTADTQLKEHGQNVGKIFAYPYGNPSINAENVLLKYGYNIAFTTVRGTLMCKGLRYNLPRIRIGGGDLSRYGL